MNTKKHLSPSDDLALIKKAQAGDTRAFTKLVKHYEDLVYSFAFKVCRDKEKAEEAWQDTFINVYRKLHQFNGKSKFTTWLYSIVVNHCKMKHRKTKLEMASIRIDEPHEDHKIDSDRGTMQTVPPWRDTPLDAIMNKELRAILDNAIQKLPYEYRVVFILRDVEGQTAEETARILKLSIPATKSRLRRARFFLREQLNEYMTS